MTGDRALTPQPGNGLRVIESEERTGRAWIAADV